MQVETIIQRYILNSNTVLDTSLGLTWQRNPSTSEYTHANAISYCNNLNLDGRTDWKLPTLSQLESLIDNSRSSAPYIVGGNSYFTTIQNGYYWTNTYYHTSSTFYVSFSSGSSGIYGLTYSGYVLCVSRNS